MGKAARVDMSYFDKIFYMSDDDMKLFGFEDGDIFLGYAIISTSNKLIFTMPVE